MRLHKLVAARLGLSGLQALGICIWRLGYHLYIWVKKYILWAPYYFFSIGWCLGGKSVLF